jgi:hypothetical protein
MERRRAKIALWAWCFNFPQRFLMLADDHAAPRVMWKRNPETHGAFKRNCVELRSRRGKSGRLTAYTHHLFILPAGKWPRGLVATPARVRPCHATSRALNPREQMRGCRMDTGDQRDPQFDSVFSLVCSKMGSQLHALLSSLSVPSFVDELQLQLWHRSRAQRSARRRQLRVSTDLKIGLCNRRS